jgi:hypothetical protein
VFVKFTLPTTITASDGVRIAALLNKSVYIHPDQKGVVQIAGGNDADLEELLLAGFVAEKVKMKL